MSAAPRKVPRLHAIGERLASFEVPLSLRRPLRWLGYPAFALLVALITFAATLPREKIKDQLEFLLSQDPTLTQPLGIGMDVKAGELTLSVLGRGLRAENVVLRTRPPRAGDKPARYVLDEVKVNIGFFGALLSRPTYDFVIQAFHGVIEGTIRVTMTDNTYRIDWNDLALGAVQGLQTGLGLPLDGKADGKLELDAPGRLLANANGSFEINIDEATIGDGKAKLSIPSDPFLAQGVTVPKIRIGKLNVSATIEKGKARIDTFHSHSQDGDVTIEGYIDLRDPLPSSQVHLYLRFKLSDALLKRESTLELVTSSLNTDGKRSDGYIGAQITGSIGFPLLKANKNPPAGVVTKADTSVPAPTPAPGATTPIPATPPPALALPAAPPAAPPVVDAAQPAPEPAKEAPAPSVAPPSPGLRQMPHELQAPTHAEEAAPTPPASAPSPE